MLGEDDLATAGRILRGEAWMRFFFQAEDGIRGADVTGVQTCALPISPRSAGGPDRPQRGLLQGLQRLSPGDDLARQAWLSLPGAALLLAGRTSRDLGAGAAAVGLRQLPPESRSGRQLGPRRALSPPRLARPLPGPDGAAAARAGDAHALPGTGVLRLPPLPLLRPPQPGAGASGAQGAPGVPLAVPQPGHARDPGGRAGPGVSRALRALQARLRGAAAARRLLRP